MNDRFFWVRPKYLLPAFAIFLLIADLDGASSSAPPRSRRTADASRVLKRMMIPGTEDLQLIIELSDPAVLDRMQGNASTRQAEGMRLPSQRNRKMNFASAQALTYRQQISRNQELMKKKILEFSGAEVLGSTDTLMNTVIARVPAAQYWAVRRLAGVKKVYFSRPKRMLLDQAALIHNAQNLWTAAGGQGNAGHGIKIGIIDSGIEITNPMFSGTGFTAPSGFPKSDTPADLSLTNSKIIVARSYVSLLYYWQRNQTAVDEIGHGTFVAGCAAGNAVSAPLASISGMAPGAYLGNYKILGTPGVNDGTTSAAEIAAINDAVADGMDIINLSIGALDYLPPEEDAEYQAINKAVQAGVVVTIAAGNDGSMTHTVSNPGAIPNAITVGSVTSSREFLAALHTTNPDQSTIGYLPSEDGIQVQRDDMPSTKIIDVASLDGDGLGCSAFPSASLNGAIALVERGTCTFATKVSNAAGAGATAVVVYNNVPIGMVRMIGLSSAMIPAVMISMNDGVILKQYVDAHPSEAQVSIGNSNTFQSVATPARVVSYYSSVGPSTDFGVKPDMVAVGENVYSATQKTLTSGFMYDASGFTVSQGTSFSAPMVAGAAAALKQHFPSLGALAIKSLLTTTAGRNLTANGTDPPNVLQAGSGLLNMTSAINANAVFSPTSLNFGVHSYDGTLSLSATLTIENISSTSNQFTFGVEPIVAGPTITFSKSRTVAVPAGSSATMDVLLQITAPATGGFQGFITVTSLSTSFAYRIPYWAGLYVPDSTRVLQISQNGSGSGRYSTLAAAIAAAQPGNIVEIEDSANYSGGPDGLLISTNSDGLPLHGLTIRAAAGKSPVIEASDLSTGIRIIGLKDVLIQGVQIKGGYTGIELYQPSPTVPLSVTIDQCTITDAFGDAWAAGVFVEGGGNVEITQSILENSSGFGAIMYVSGGTGQLTVTGSTIQQNGSDGVLAYGSNIFVSDSTFSNNSGAGLDLVYCTGTVDGNRLASNQTSSNYGDGLQITNGKTTVKNNVFDSNEESAIYLTADSSDAGAHITGNKAQLNSSYAIHADSFPSVVAEGNLLKSNGGGFYLSATSDAHLLNNIIAKSTDSSIGSGVEVDSGSNVRITNGTIYQNALYGVLLTSGTVSVDNSIVYGNKGGELQAVPAESVHSSLVGIDPQFVSPDSDDFSLASNSPAIDSGSNAAADLPFVDYNGKLRVSSATTLPGQGTVDAGAVESSSAYPLVYPLAVHGSDSTLNGNFNTGIVFMNPNSTADELRFTAFDGTGGVLAGTQNPAVVPLGTQAQVPILDYQLFGLDSTGSSRASVLGYSNQKADGFFLVIDSGFRKFATGANASTRLSNELVFMRHQSDSDNQTSYVIFNPGTNSANILATLYNSDGAAAGQPKTAVIAAKAHLIIQFGSAVSSGYVRVDSDRPVSGVELVGNENVEAALGAASPGSQARLFFPHFAVGGHYSTQVGIVNTSSSSTALRLSAFDGNGNLIGSVDSVTLAAGGQLVKTITELFGIPADGPLQTGYLIAQSDQPGIMGFTDFRYADGERNADASIPADSTPSRRLLFSHIAHGVSAGTGVPYQTGIALLNPFGTDIEFTIRVYDGAGTLVAQAEKTIGPHQKLAKYLSYPIEGVGFFLQDIWLRNGHVEVTSDYGLIGLEIFFTDDVSQLAGVPAQIGD